jgi:hypothetical protein
MDSGNAVPLQKNRLPGAGRGSRISKGRRGPTHLFEMKTKADSQKVDLFGRWWGGEKSGSRAAALHKVSGRNGGSPFLEMALFLRGRNSRLVLQRVDDRDVGFDLDGLAVENGGTVTPLAHGVGG